MKFAEKFLLNFFASFNVDAISEKDKDFECQLTATTFSPSDIASIQSSFDFLQPQ